MRDKVLQKEEKKQKKAAGASTNDTKKEDGIIRDIKGDVCCCIPFIQCMKKGNPLPTSIEEGVKLCCTNDCIFSKNPVHIECFESLEQNLITMLSHQRTCKKGVIKAWLDSSNEVNLWGKVGLGFIQKTIRCPCGKGQMFRDEDAWIKRELLLQPLKDKKDKKTTKPKATLPALQLTVKKGAAPPPGFHDLDNHYLSSKSPPPTSAKNIDDKYAPPEIKAKKVRHSSYTSSSSANNTVLPPKPLNVFNFASAAAKVAPPKYEPSKKLPIGYSPIEPKIAKSFEEPKVEHVEESKDIRSSEMQHPNANSHGHEDIQALLESCEINAYKKDSSSENEEDSSEEEVEEEEDENNEINANSQETNEISGTNTTTSETSSEHSYKNPTYNRVSIAIQTDETSFIQSAYGPQKLYSPNLSYIWNPLVDSRNTEQFDDYSMRRFTDNNSVIRKDSNTSSIVNQPYYKEKEEVFSTPKITFLFRNDETFGVEVYQNGGTEKLKNDGGNEWTPMYLSMVKGSPIIGESAKSDYRNFPNYVVYDILKVIGKPVHVINHMDPKPKNNISVKDEENCFVVKTPCAEDRHISEERIMAAFLKIQKEQVEKSLKTDIKSVFISTDFALTDFQKAVFLKAASKLKLEILSFALNY